MEKEKPYPQFTKELMELLNKHSLDAATSTPDFLLAEMLVAYLEAYRKLRVWQIDWESKF